MSDFLACAALAVFPVVVIWLYIQIVVKHEGE